MFSKEFDLDTMLKNLEYYETRTEHGSSLSACMYALLACKCNRPDKAYDFFMKSASADIKQGGKESAGFGLYRWNTSGSRRRCLYGSTSGIWRLKL